MNESRGARNQLAREVRGEREACRPLTRVRKTHSLPFDHASDFRFRARAHSHSFMVPAAGSSPPPESAGSRQKLVTHALPSSQNGDIESCLDLATSCSFGCI
jgi:hypothetical protein